MRDPKFGATLKAVRCFLLLAIAFGAGDFIFKFGREDFGNPYLQVSLWRPVFTVHLPGIWLLLLNTKAVSSYCSSGDAPVTHQGTTEPTISQR